ncbi:MAG: hypothetical protein ACFFD2_07140 [Promethearchaeota archaeon]
MSWEETHRKEQIFRKANTNREAILKTIENEDGKIILSFSLKNDSSITELSLSINEWKSILAFLNRTSEQILNGLDKKSVIPIAIPIADIKSESTTDEVIELAPTEIIPVSNETFDELNVEMQKVPQLIESQVQVVPCEEVITEMKPEVKKVIEKEAHPQDNDLEEIKSTQELEPTQELDLLISDLKKPALKSDYSPEISMDKLLEENKTPNFKLPIKKDTEIVSTDEKEEKIIAAMEEVAALMPPGPAKKFVEDMMLKRTAQTGS